MAMYCEFAMRPVRRGLVPYSQARELPLMDMLVLNQQLDIRELEERPALGAHLGVDNAS